MSDGPTDALQTTADAGATDKRRLPPVDRSSPYDPSDSTIRENTWVFLQMPSGNSRATILRSGMSIDLGKFGSFKSDWLIGKHYFVPYEIVVGKSGGLRPALNFSTIEDFDLGETEVDASNKTIVDDPLSQKLSQKEIEELKSQSLQGLVDHSSLIQKIVENNAAFEKKTDFSKIKYIKRKQRKYSKVFTPLKPTARLICEYYTSRAPAKALGIRIDTLSQMLTQANVRAGGRFLVADDTNGLLVSAMVERMHEWGEIVAFHGKEQPNLELVYKMGFPQNFTDIISTLPWFLFEKDPENPESQNPAASERDVARYNVIVKLRERILKGGYDGLLVASRYNAKQIIKTLTPLLAWSKPVVIYSPYKECLLDVYNYIRSTRSFLNTQLTESWLREYQVPVQGTGTHPMMSTSGSGGFLVTATTMKPVPEEESIANLRAKRLRLEEEKSKLRQEPAQTSASGQIAPAERTDE